jgi:hypothetical protein
MQYRTQTYLPKLIHQNLFTKTYSPKLIQQNLFFKSVLVRPRKWKTWFPLSISSILHLNARKELCSVLFFFLSFGWMEKEINDRQPRRERERESVDARLVPKRVINYCLSNRVFLVLWFIWYWLLIHKMASSQPQSTYIQLSSKISWSRKSSDAKPSGF